MRDVGVAGSDCGRAKCAAYLLSTGGQLDGPQGREQEGLRLSRVNLHRG